MHKYADILVIPAWSKVCNADISASPVERVKDCSTLYQPASRRCLGNSLSNIERPMSMVLAPSLTMTQSVTNTRKKFKCWDNVTYFMGIQNTFSVQRNLETQSIQYWIKTGKQFYSFHRGSHYNMRNILDSCLDMICCWYSSLHWEHWALTFLCVYGDFFVLRIYNSYKQGTVEHRLSKRGHPKFQLNRKRFRQYIQRAPRDADIRQATVRWGTAWYGLWLKIVLQWNVPPILMECCLSNES